MSRTKQLTLGAAAAFLALLSAGTLAHHGWSGYESALRKVSGEIEQVNYSNPHVSIHLKAPDQSWVVVLAPPSRMGTRGLTEGMLKVGSTVSVEGYRNASDKGEMRAERISVAGKSFELR